MFSEADFPLESVILLIGGLALAITGGLLFPVAAGRLPYYENGFFGLLLIVFALQTITLGKTPFGDLRRSKTLLFFGVAVAAVGIVTCFIPGLFGPLPRMLLLACFGLGGVLQLLRAGRDETRLRSWLRYGGIFRHLFFACAGVYGLSMLAGLLLWTQPPLPTRVTATGLLLFGFTVIYLGGVLRLVYRAYPEAESAGNDRARPFPRPCHAAAHRRFHDPARPVADPRDPWAAPLCGQRAVGPADDHFCHSDAGVRQYPHRPLPSPGHGP